ncbi:dephospho-kinase [Cryptosporidium ubiquitum]|uniref:Dephospho-kinase n=1 Tax=Cryptosporidium ubiquitum TaxID=857276 RepID=A0A1J4MG15_9CRYT|nr:dephospho-kinase [Cryptosporidium ubiquitum]OII72395.1 dephospho-kinase [Cryptosporidium ubiquitum]
MNISYLPLINQFQNSDILKEFGDKLANEDGSLNRKLLRSIVFEDPLKRKKLNKITHSRIFSATLYEIFYHRVFILFTRFRNVKTVLVSPLLFESKVFTWICSPIYVVFTNREQQIKYLMERDFCTRTLAENMIDSQMSLETKCELADKVFWNNNSLHDLQIQIKSEFSLP